MLHVASLSARRERGVRRFAYKQRTKCECPVRLQYVVMALARRGSVCVWVTYQLVHLVVLREDLERHLPPARA